MRLSFLLCLSFTLAAAAPPPEPSVDVTGRLAQVRAFAAGRGERLWPGYGSAPFGFLLVGAENETLLCQPGKPAGFADAGRDPATGCARLTRPKSGLPASLLAAMPLLGPPSTIVMGTPATTGRPPPDWLRTILHEHFHQWQAGLPAYYQRVAALGLAGTDTSGMWMLNYPFPYDDAATGRAYAGASRALADALAARGTRGFPAAFERYLAARRAFAEAAGEKNWRYLDFQLWQEGVARWTEIALGRSYPDPAVRASAAALQRRTLEALRAPALATQRRELAYPYGGGEAMLLEACGSRWRTAYPKVLALGPLLESARGHCSRR